MYIPNAYALVDSITNLIDFLGQRRRWINGTWFAVEYVLENQDRLMLENLKEGGNVEGRKFHGPLDRYLLQIAMIMAWI